MFVRRLVTTLVALTTLGTAGSAFAARKCEGTYRINAIGYTGTMEIDQRRNQINGTIRWDDGRFGVSAINGSCDVVGRSGTISFVRPDANQYYTGSVTIERQVATLVGTFQYGARVYNWSATEVAQSNSRACSGSYRINATGYGGQMTILGTASGLTGNVVWDDRRFGISQITGSCALDRRTGTGSIQFNRPDAGQYYTGNLSFVGDVLTMSGTFAYGSRSYGWSAQANDLMFPDREVR